MVKLLYDLQPDEIYLGSESHVRVSFDAGVHRRCSRYRANSRSDGSKLVDKVRFYQASSSEMFGKVQEVPLFGLARHRLKMYAHWLTVNYRESCCSCSGILYHECLKPSTFDPHQTGFTGKTYQSAQRDWGYAKEYVEMMWLMLQQDEPDDYVIATNETHSVKDFVIESFDRLGLDWGKYVEYDDRYERPAEVDLLIGNPEKAKRKLNWEPKVKFKDLVRIMIDADLRLRQNKRSVEVVFLSRNLCIQFF